MLSYDNITFPHLSLSSFPNLAINQVNVRRNTWADPSLGYLQLLQVTIGYQHYQGLGMCACNMLLAVTLGYLQLLQVTSVTRGWECAHVTCGWPLLWVTCSYFRLPLVTSVTRGWECVHVTCGFVSLAVRFLVNVFLGIVVERVLHTSNLPLPGCWACS